MGNKQSAASSKQDLVAEDKCSENEAEACGANAGEDSTLLRAQIEELQDQLQSIRAQAQENKDQEQVALQQWETRVEALKTQVKTSGEELALAREQAVKQRQEHIVAMDAKSKELICEVAKQKQEHTVAMDAKSKEIAAARSATLEKAEAGNCLAARVAQLEVEVAAAQEDASSANARAKASTEREAKAVHQRILAESAHKTAEMAQAAAEARAAATTGASNTAQDAAVERAAYASKLEQELQGKNEELALALRAKAEASDAAAALQKKLDAKTEELDAKKNVGDNAKSNATKLQQQLALKTQELATAIAAKKAAATELLTSKSQLTAKTQELAAAITAKTEAVEEAAAAKVEFEAKTQDLMVKMEEELTKMMEGKMEEHATDASASTPEATMLRQELSEMMNELDLVREELKAKRAAFDEVGALKLKLDAKTKELAAAQAAEGEATRQLEDLQSQQEATDVQPLKKMKLEPTDENAPPTQGKGMQDEQVQLLLGEMEKMQEEKKKRDKVLKDFKQLKKMTVEQFVESLSAESDVNKAAAKSKGKRPTVTAAPDSAKEVKRVRAASPAPRR